MGSSSRDVGHILIVLSKIKKRRFSLKVGTKSEKFPSSTQRS